ncbi:recombinase family protein [Maricaulaceae bacterium EIL42A08]|nr:recombinase family protein [Maricaulaceae bacterium EIL42A08]
MSETVGYARTSTVDQSYSYQDQLDTLQREGCTKVFSEQVSAVAQERPEFDAALSYLRQGDTLVVTKLDRLARSLPDLMSIRTELETRGVGLRVLDMGLDTSTPHGKMVMGIIGSVAEFERSLMLERQRIGIAKAKEAGKYKGRAPTAMAKAEEIKALAAQGVAKTEIAQRLGIGRASVYRALQAE